MTAPWLEDRRYHRPDARHTAGLTYDDIQPTQADDAELRRALRKQDEPWEHAWNVGVEHRPNPFPDDEALTRAWLGGWQERNRRRQERVWAWLCKVVGKKRNVKIKRKRRR